MKTCQWHLCNTTLSGRQTKFCSIQCKNKEALTRWRRNLKTRALAYKGGARCNRCGYDKCHRALVFHHIDEQDKEFSISKTGNTIAWHRVQKELDKCIVLCANCHAEVHSEIA